MAYAPHGVKAFHDDDDDLVHQDLMMMMI